MAKFLSAFEFMMKNEGGYILHEVEGDRGGQTYAGIARNFHPDWAGWHILDKNVGVGDLTRLVRKFYSDKFWNPIMGDDIISQDIAECLFDFGVNTGVKRAVKIAQIVVGSTPDGYFGNKTLTKINAMSSEDFVIKYTLAKLARYVNICKRDPVQKKFLYGWCYRLLKGLS